MNSKFRKQELSAQEQKEIREGALVITRKCPDGSVRDSVTCSTTNGEYEEIYSHSGTRLIGLRCENVYVYCDGHDHIDTGSGTGSGTDGSGAEDSGSESSGADGSGTFFGMDDTANGNIKLL